MIDIKPVSIEAKALYERYLFGENERGCEYSFANLYVWGQQNAAFLHNHIALLSKFDNRIVYPYPIGYGDKKPVLDAIIDDARARGIQCCITGMRNEESLTLERFYPKKFRFEQSKGSFDYVYNIDDLADLKGRKYHKKRNHFYHFCSAFPHYTVEPLSEDNLPYVKHMADAWYTNKLCKDPSGDYHMEQSALTKALNGYKQLEMEGLVLKNGEDVFAVTLGSRMSANTFDVHFEKARWDIDGAYTAINCEFARYIRSKFPEIRFLNREEDMGLEGLRKAKQSYYPHHMVEKYRAYLTEDRNEH